MADTEISNLTAITASAGEDLLAIIDDPSGTPASRKITLENFFDFSFTNANTGLDFDNFSLTGSDASSLISLAGTWNTTGTPIGLLVNITDTASNAASLLADLQIGGTSKFSFSKAGDLTITPDANGNALSVSGYSLTGSDATEMIDFAGTWNTTGTPTAIKLNITDTASNAASLLMDLQVGGSTQISVEKDGTLNLDGVATVNFEVTQANQIQGTNSRLNYFLNSARQGVLSNTTYSGFVIGSAMRFAWVSDTTLAANWPPTVDTALAREAAGVVSVYADNSNTLGGAYAAPDAGELTIATGAVTVTGTYHTIDTEADAASDDLDTISGGNDGQVLIIQAENTARTVVAKDGTGNLNLAGDFSLDNTQDSLMLLFSSALSAWVEISRSDNGA